jgi:hypothetical protein
MAIPKAPAVPTMVGQKLPAAAVTEGVGGVPLSTVGESTGNESLSFFVANTGAAPAPGALMPTRTADLGPAAMPAAAPAPVGVGAAATAGASGSPQTNAPSASKSPPLPPRASTSKVGGNASKPSFRSATLLGLASPAGAAPSTARVTATPVSPTAPAAASAPSAPPAVPRPSTAPGPRASKPPAEPPTTRASKSALDAVPTQLGGFDAGPAAAGPGRSARASTAAAAPTAATAPTAPTPPPQAQRKPPYVNIHLDRPAPEDLTPTIPRDAIAYIEAHGGTVPGSGASTPATATGAVPDDDPEAGWDDPPEIAAAPLVPQVPVVLAGSSPSLPTSPAPPPVTEIAPSHLPYATDGVEDLSSRHLLSEVDDALPTPAINGLPDGVLDAVPLARAIAEATRAASGAPRPSVPPPVPAGPRHFGVVPPPPLPPPSGSAATATDATAPVAHDPSASADSSSTVPPPANAVASPEIPVLSVVSAPSAAQKTQKILRPANVPRLVPEVMTPALLSAGPYRGEVHLEANASGPALPAVAGLYDPIASAPMLRDAQPTVVAQHRLAEAALAARRQVDGGFAAAARSADAPPPRRPGLVLGALAVGAFAAVFLLGLGVVTGLPSRPGASVALASRASLPLARAMFEARRSLEDSAPSPAVAPATHAPAASAERPAVPEPVPEAAPASPPPPSIARRAGPSRAPHRTPTSAKAVARGSTDGF